MGKASINGCRRVYPVYPHQNNGQDKFRTPYDNSINLNQRTYFLKLRLPLLSWEVRIVLRAQRASCIQQSLQSLNRNHMGNYPVIKINLWLMMVNIWLIMDKLLFLLDTVIYG